MSTPLIHDEHARAHARQGFIFGFTAYALWGLFPLYWALLQPAMPAEILADRFLWSFVFLLITMAATRSWSRLQPVLASRRTLGMLALAAVLISINWFLYIWAVNNQHVVEGSLGYFINPLVLIVIGTLFMGEQLRKLQWLAVGIAAIAVVVLTFGYGRVPWIALTLAFSFAGYGFVKKLVGADPIASLTVETAYATPLAIGYLLWLQSQGQLVFGHHSVATTALLAGCGVVTAVPLLLFGGAANRIPLSAMGVLQYITPTIQFILGILLLTEHMPPLSWIGFTIVWLALVIFTYDSLHNGHRNRTARKLLESDDVEAPL